MRACCQSPKCWRVTRNAPNIEIVGMGYYPPILPLIPTDDWDEQIALGREKIREIFGREPKTFWPPEMAFSREIIPALARHGYERVIIDSVHVKLGLTANTSGK